MENMEKAKFKDIFLKILILNHICLHNITYICVRTTFAVFWTSCQLFSYENTVSMLTKKNTIDQMQKKTDTKEIKARRCLLVGKVK